MASRAGSSEPTRPDPRLARVASFHYQLQQADLKLLASSAVDLVVLDHSRDGSEDAAYSSQEIALVRGSGASAKVALCYLSIGEAEDYRAYWKRDWRPETDTAAGSPPFLGPVNPDWPGNYKVRYWLPEWKAVLRGGPSACLDRILAQGFDGVYLDIIDAYDFWRDRGVKDAEDQMVDLVKELGAYARARRPGFLVFPQNKEELGARRDYLEAVDGIGREDLYFEGDKRQDAGAIAEAEAHLDRFRQAGKPVLLIEYCRRAGLREEVERRARARGYVPLCAERALDRPPEAAPRRPGK
ncbi:MAG: endo alpha-1,4 polygalactosaminidase [Planctomycetes bacterium]|nr:endo alpha-1,4 polygalactosaminidase [Planctomycetota bacterium]